jgi:hypothetical protein
MSYSKVNLGTHMDKLGTARKAWTLNTSISSSTKFQFPTLILELVEDERVMSQENKEQSQRLCSQCIFFPSLAQESRNPARKWEKPEISRVLCIRS